MQFRMGVVVVLLFGVALYGTTFILPQFTQRLLNYPAYQAGLVLMPRAVALMCVLPLVGKLYNYFDPRLVNHFWYRRGVCLLLSAGPFSHHGRAGQYYADPFFDGIGDAVYFCFINDGIFKLCGERKYDLGIRIV